MEPSSTGFLPESPEAAVRVTLARLLAVRQVGAAVPEPLLLEAVEDTGVSLTEAEHALARLEARREVYRTAEGWRFVPARWVRAPMAELILSGRAPP